MYVRVFVVDRSLIIVIELLGILKAPICVEIVTLFACTTVSSFIFIIDIYSAVQFPLLYHQWYAFVREASSYSS